MTTLMSEQEALAFTCPTCAAEPSAPCWCAVTLRSTGQPFGTIGPHYERRVRQLPAFTYVVDVGFTTVRPVIPDQHTSRVTLLADTDREAADVAFSMIYGRPSVEMVTRLEIVSVVL